MEFTLYIKPSTGQKGTLYKEGITYSVQKKKGRGKENTELDRRD